MSVSRYVHDWGLPLVFFVSSLHTALCQSGYDYVLDTEYTGANFFNGWKFFTSGDPTNGFVQYVDQQTALNYGMINSSDTAPTYIGVDYVSKMMPGNNGAGRSSVRISTTKVWTHGLFIGDFAHAPGGICGTWPAWWTIGPNWPYTGEIDILEGVNLLTTNVMSLHTSPNYTIAGDSNTETGILQASNCAYYQGGGNGVGCGVADTRNTSYGAGFNAIGGGVYAMQWTSDFIKVWFFPRSQIPADITNKRPDPSSWGLPAADLIGTGNNIDEHFVDHAIVFDNTFCGDYAGAPGVWNDTGNPSISCAARTGYSTCAQFVGAVPGAFKDSYWSINSVRVYQIRDPSNTATTSSSTSLTPTFTQATTTVPVPTASVSLCPTYNFTEVSYGGQTYEVECGFTLNGDDLGHPYPSYPNPASFEDCVAMCNYWTMHNSTTCIGVAYVLSTKGCYPKDKSYGNQVNPGQYAARLIWAGYGDITDAPPTATTSTSKPTSTATSNFSTVTPVHYSNPTVSQSSVVLSTASEQSSILGGGMGVSLTSSYISSLTPYSSTLPVSTSALASNTISAFSSTSSSSSSLTYSLAVSLGTVVLSSLLPQLSSTPFSSLKAVSSAASPLTSLMSSSQLAATSTFIMLSSSGTSSGLPLAPSSTIPSISFLSPISVPSSVSVLPPSSSATFFPVFSSGPTTLTSSSSLSSLSVSSAVEITSSSSGLPLTSAIPVSIPSPLPSLPSFPPSSSSVSVASSSIVIDPQSVLPSITIPGPTTTTSSTTVPPNNGDATNYVGFASTSTTPPSPPATTDEGNTYAGCLGYAVGSGAFQQVEQSPAMTIEQCLSDCFESFYAGVSGQSCYCGNSLDSTADLTKYPESDCNLPCPGDPLETCGGDFADEMSRRRQSIMLLTTYNNTVNINSAQPPSGIASLSSTQSSTSSPFSASLPLTSSSTTVLSSTISPTTSVLSSSSASLSTNGPNISGASGADGIPTSVSPISWSHPFNPRTSSTTPSAIPFGSSVLSNSAQSIPLVISTVWVDVCDICEHGLTTKTTTITSLHCGCTDTPAPVIPMTTSTKACAVCGEGGTPSTVMVTCPDTNAIASAYAAASLPVATGLASITTSITGGGTGQTYGNTSISGNGTAKIGIPGGPGAAAVSGSGAIQAPAAGDEWGATPARSGSVPLETNSTAASSSSGAPVVSDAGSTATTNASVAWPTETFMFKSSNKAGAVFCNMGAALFAVLIAVLLT